MDQQGSPSSSSSSSSSVYNDGLSEEEKEKKSGELFKENVKRMCKLQDDIKAMNKNKKEINDEMKKRRELVMGYMLEREVSKCNYLKDEIYVNKRTSAGSLSRSSLRKAIDDYFGEDVAEATSCYDYIIESLGTKEVIELKRKKRKIDKSERETTKKIKTENTENE